jgi:hypothetical protein
VTDAGRDAAAAPSRQPLLDALGVALPDEVLTLALTHRSYAYEHGGLPTNERLEFLGDAVLELTVTVELFQQHPDRPEEIWPSCVPAWSTPRRWRTSPAAWPAADSASTCCWAGAN